MRRHIRGKDANASQYRTDPEVSNADTFEHVRELNARTFLLGTAEPHFNDFGEPDGYLFRYKFPVIPYHPKDPLNPLGNKQAYIGIDATMKNAKIADPRTPWNTFLVGIDCSSVVTSFPGQEYH